MKIAIDVSRALEAHKTGIPIYQENLFGHLLRQPGSHNFVPLYYGPKIDHAGTFTQQPILPLYNPFIYEYSSFKGMFDGKPLRSLKEAKIDLMHGTAHFIVKGFEEQSVLTIHDLIFLHDKGAYNRSLVEQLKRCVRKVKKIIAVSQTTKDEVLKEFPSIPEGRIEVIYEGAREGCSQITDKEALKRFRKNFFGSEDFKYILFLGSFTRRKNLLNIIRAFDVLVKTHAVPHKLVLVGKPADVYKEMMELIASCGLGDKVIINEYIQDNFLQGLLSGADAFLFPSYYEGFGLPVIEAMQCGCPCVVSNVSSLKELFADSALMVDPDDPSDIAKAVYRLISDPQLHAQYRELGFKKTQTLNWKNTAEQTLRVYGSMA